jgi:hypothetical protein
MVYTHQADIITVSESWLDDSIPDYEIDLPDYQLYRKDRTRHGGGVLVYVHDTISVTRRVDLEHDDIETLWLELQMDNGRVLIGTYYRPPGADEQTITEFMTALQDSMHCSPCNT